jgi:glycerol kinase
VLAGIGAGLYADLPQAAQAWQLERKFSPKFDDQKRKTLTEGYQLAVRQVLTTVTQ